MKKLSLMTFIFIGLTACSQSSNPTEEKIRAVLADKVNKKGCASSVLFKEFPIPKSQQTNNNQRIIQPFINVGLIEESRDAYLLTEQGRSAYDQNASGFCYTDQYTISDISVVKKEMESDLPSALSGAWYVTFKVSPQNVDEWVKSPEIVQAASRASIEEITKTHSFTVRLATKHGEDKLILADPRFSFSPRIHFNMGW